MYLNRFVIDALYCIASLLVKLHTMITFSIYDSLSTMIVVSNNALMAVPYIQSIHGLPY